MNSGWAAKAGDADRVGVENLANLDKLPPRGAAVVLALIPWKEGSGGPARVFATA